MDPVSQLLALMMLFAVLHGNWQEAGGIKGADNLFKRILWFIAVILDDFIAALFILGVLSLATGGEFEEGFMMILPWLGITILILRSSGGIKWGSLLNKLGDDLRDGGLIVFFLILWYGWANISIPLILQWNL